MNRLTTKIVRLSATLVLAGSLTGSSSSFAAEGAVVPDAKAVMMYNLGITAYRQQSTDAAVIFFKRACDIDPNLADAQYNLAVIYQAQHRYKEAIPRFEEVLRLKPNDPDAHFQLGIVLQESGRAQEAHQHFSSIAPNNPHYPDAQRHIAALGQAPGQVAAAPYQQPLQAQPPAYQPPANGNMLNAPINDGTPIGQSNAGTPIGLAISPVQPTTQAPMQTTMDTQPAYNPPMTAGIPTQMPEASPAMPLPGGDSPVPVQANTSLRVIATGFNAPSGLTVDRNGNLYVANYNSNTIERIAPDGTRAQFTSGNNLRGPIGLVADETGNLYVANYAGGTVIKVNPAGVSTVIASGFKKPYYLTLDRDGNLYVSQQEDNSIVRIVLKTTTAAKNP
jgi:Tfp pilus assembly protein PilF